MYDPPYLNHTSPFPELDDPKFWEQIATKTSIPSIPEPTYAIPSSVYEEPPRRIVEGWLVPVPQTRALTPYLPIDVPQAPRQEPHETNKSSDWLTKYFLWGFVLVIAVVFLVSVPVRHSESPAPLAPDTSYSLLGGPSVEASFIDRVLTHYGSPAAGKGQALYDLGVKSGIDPVFALAFFMHESSFGKEGMATVTEGLGNERCIPDRPCINSQGGQCESGQSCYAQFSSWEDGFGHWYMLITGPVYKGSGLTTIDTIIPRYAPNADHNNEAGYIASVKKAVATWRAGHIEVA